MKAPLYTRVASAFRDDTAELHGRLAYDLHRFWDANGRRLVPLRRAFEVAALALVAETLALTLLVGNGDRR